MRFHQERYEDAVRLLEKARTLDHDPERKELELSYLGRCYLALGRNNDALEHLSAAYEAFRDPIKTLKTDFEQKEFLDFLNAYRIVLEKVGESDRAQELARQAQEYRETLKRR